MRRSTLCFFALLILLTAASLQAQSVVMISIDGMRPDYITDPKACNAEFPTLRSFLTHGTFAEGVVGVLPTVTYPSHTTLITGVEPARHGIVSNATFDPEGRNQGGWYWYAEDIKADTLWDAAARKGLVTASIGWPVTVGERNIRYNIPEYWRAWSDEDRKLVRALSTPEFYDALESKFRSIPVTNGSSVASDAALTDAAIWAITVKHAHLVTLHLASLDHEEHGHGPFSTEACRTLVELDKQVGKLEQAALANDPATVIAVVSDHGFSRTDHKVNLNAALVRAGLITMGGTNPAGIAAWKAITFGGGGSTAIVLHDPADKATEEAVRTLLQTLAADPANGIGAVLEKADIEKLGGAPTASFFVDFRLGYQMGWASKGDLVTPAPNTGSHGYLPTHPELRASFFIRGRGIAVGRDLGVIDMRQIAPTLAHLLGIKLKDAQQPPLKISY